MSVIRPPLCSLQVRITSSGAPSSNLPPMLAVVGSISHLGNLLVIWSIHGVSFAFPFAYFMQRRLSLYFLPPFGTLNLKAVTVKILMSEIFTSFLSNLKIMASSLGLKYLLIIHHFTLISNLGHFRQIVPLLGPNLKHSDTMDQDSWFSLITNLKSLGFPWCFAVIKDSAVWLITLHRETHTLRYATIGPWYARNK